MNAFGWYSQWQHGVTKLQNFLAIMLRVGIDGFIGHACLDTSSFEKASNKFMVVAHF